MSFEVINKIEKLYSQSVTLFFEGDVEVCEHISPANQEFMKKMIEDKNFTGKREEKITFNFLENGNIINLTYAGMGKREEFCRNKYRIDLYNVLKNFNKDVLIYSKEEELADPVIMNEVVANINYNFDKYLADAKNKTIELSLFKENCDCCLKESNILEAAVAIAKDLVNEPANVIYPETLAKKAEELGKEYGFETEILDEFAVEKLGMGAFLSVGKASAQRPRLIVMRYFGDPENPEQKIAIIGKGLTYDSGGLSIKPTDSMKEMKDDMGGSATAIGTLCAASKAKLKKNIIGIVAACENFIGSNSYRPGDIVTSMSGKTIEVVNTDAEGRMTLADAITYAIEVEKATELVDIATLTGAVVVALGNGITGVFTNNNDNFKKLEAAGKNWNEKYWNMPMDEDYVALIKSDIADLKNSGGRWGGSITAALFLQEFTQGVPWMHLDIAGTVASDKNGKWYKKGATGVAVKTLYSYLKG